MSKTHKILLYTDTPLYGGAEKHMLLLAKSLNRKNFNPIIVCRKSKNLEKWCKELAKNKIETIITDTPNKNSPSNLTQLNKIIKKHKPEIIHAHIWNPVACKYAFAAAWLNNIPLVTTEHDPFPLTGHKKIYKKLTLGQCKRIITVSLANQTLFNDLYPASANKTITIHNGIEKASTELSEQHKHHLKKDDFHAGQETKIVFSAGALHPRKGYKYLINAFKKVVNKVDNVKLVIAGSGPERNKLEKLIKNLRLEKKVILLGQRDDIEKLMLASNIFVLPSLKEAFGIVVLEAMQNGLPIIASNVGGIPEIISSEKLGLLVKPGQKDSLSKALIKLLKDEKLRNTFATKGQEHWKDFSVEKMAKKTEEVYYQALTNTK